jgi:hypothetical protein
VAELESRGILETARSGNLSNEQRVEIIKLSYELLERHSQSTVSDLGFELSGFGFIGADEFQKIRYGDIVTLTGGDVIDMSRKRHTNGNTGAVTIEYIPVWGKHPGAAAQDVAGRRLETLSLAEVLEASKDHPELSAVSSATQYTVTVNLRGESRTYQAAFFWRPSVPGSEIAFYSVDLITQGVQEVALDPDLTVTRPLRGSSEETDTHLTQQAQASGERCDEFLQGDVFAPRKQLGRAGHFKGEHWAQPLFEHECSCDVGCVSRCSAMASPLACDDRGLLSDGLCHKMTHGFDDSSYTVYSGVSRGASCSTGFGCAAKSCIGGCFCAGTTVNVKALEGSASVSFGSGALWTGKFTHGVDCSRCQSIQNPPPPRPPGDPTPMVIDLDRGGFQMTSAAGGVDFDIDDDGEVERVSWTDRRSGDAFLARDRNSNGVIDDGGELFGNVSPQPDSERRNGFHALAMFDEEEAGGNADGVISGEDAASVLLLLWTDSNHDGVSQRDEIVSFLEHLREIDLTYVESQRADRHGNLFRLKSMVRLADGKRTQANDVTLLLDE